MIAFCVLKSKLKVIEAVVFIFACVVYVDVFIPEPALIAKSNIILDVKPWDDETDMKLMEAAVRAISTDGLLWGACEYNEMHSVQFYVPQWP